jgi:hypothetical protein
MDIDKILESSKNMGESIIITSDLDKKILDLLEQVYTTRYPGLSESQHPWTKGTQIIEVLIKYGNANVRSHMTKLVEKKKLEAKLIGTKKVYRLIVEEKEL